MNKIKVLGFLIGVLFGGVFMVHPAFASDVINSEVSSNEWYILDSSGSHVSCPSPTPLSWERFINDVSDSAPSGFSCVSPPWSSNVTGLFSGIFGTPVVGDRIRYEFWSGTSQTGINQGHIELTWDGSSGVPTTASTTSRIISVSPSDDGVASSPVTFNIHWFIAQVDIDKGSSGFLGVGSANYQINIQLCPLNTIPSSQCSPVIDKEFNPYDTSTTTSLSFGSTLPFRNNTDYQMVTQLTGSNYGNFLGPFISLATTTYFTVGSTTHAGNLRQFVASTTDAFRFSTSTNAYTIVNQSCNPISSGFDVALCIYSIVAPPQEILRTDIEDIKNQFATLAPWGYITRFVTIFTDTATTTLPSIDYSFATTSPLAGYDIHLDPFATLASSTSIINAVSDQSQPKTIWAIINPVANIIVYLMLILMIVKDLTGIQRHAEAEKRRS